MTITLAETEEERGEREEGDAVEGACDECGVGEVVVEFYHLLILFSRCIDGLRCSGLTGLLDNCLAHTHTPNTRSY